MVADNQNSNTEIYDGECCANTQIDVDVVLVVEWPAPAIDRYLLRQQLSKISLEATAAKEVSKNLMS